MDDLKALRRRQFLTQKELAERVGVTYQTIQAWEGGKSQPRLRHIPKLAAALGIEPAQVQAMFEAVGNAQAA